MRVALRLAVECEFILTDSFVLTSILTSVQMFKRLVFIVLLVVLAVSAVEANFGGGGGLGWGSGWGWGRGGLGWGGGWGWGRGGFWGRPYGFGWGRGFYGAAYPIAPVVYPVTPVVGFYGGGKKRGRGRVSLKFACPSFETNSCRADEAVHVPLFPLFLHELLRALSFLANRFPRRLRRLVNSQPYRARLHPKTL